MPLERGADSERDDRNQEFAGQPQDSGDFPGGLGKRHRVGKSRLEVGFIPAVAIQFGLREAEAVAEHVAQLGLQGICEH